MIDIVAAVVINRPPSWAFVVLKPLTAGGVTSFCVLFFKKASFTFNVSYTLCSWFFSEYKLAFLMDISKFI